MRLFQNVITYPNFRPLMAERNRGATSHAERVANFIDSCFINLHILKPVLEASDDAFLAIGDLPATQRAWADKQGMPGTATEADILLAQIEHHRAEVFYNWDPLRFDSSFVKRLPGHVRHSIAWHASPGPHLNFELYDRVVCNFPSILADFAKRGLKTAWFAPAHDPIMDSYADNADRPVDVLFVGGYSRHHLKRVSVLEAVARRQERWRIVYHLDTSLYGRLADSPIGVVWPLNKVRRPPSIRSVARPPVFGREMYQALSQAKIILNGAIDMAGPDRGNLRCWEAMGLGALLVSDDGAYPDGMQPGANFLSYDSPEEAVALIDHALADGTWQATAAAGRQMVRTRYSKAEQWRAFCNLL